MGKEALLHQRQTSEKEAPLAPADPHQTMLNFLDKAEQLGATSNPPKHVSRKWWERNVGILREYCQTDKGIVVIGQEHRLFKQSVSVILKQTATHIWKQSPLSLQEEFPQDQLPIYVGKKLPNKLKWHPKPEKAPSAQQLAYQENLRLAEQLRNVTEEASDEQVQSLLNQVKTAFLQSYARGGKPLLLSIAKAARRAGYFFRSDQTHLFVKALRQAYPPIPNGELGKKAKYFVMVPLHEGRAKGVWLKNEGLRRFLINPVIQICGPERPLPTIHQLQTSGQYRSLTHLFSKLGVTFGGSHLKQIDYLTDECPTPVFLHRNHRGSSHYYLVGDEELLVEYLERRVSQPGREGAA